jgi:DNA invertase Pin-like site-specific DNA recombinase
MRERLLAFGWSEIEIIDDDLGRSAAGSVARAGFERMMAAVCLGKVGAVAAREVWRFARNSRDWQQLIETCRVVDTALVDQETIYLPCHGDDRLLLGLKGTLNEYKLDSSRQRSLAARYEKTRRGELVVTAPVGFVKTGDRLERDPDRRVQERIDSWLTRIAAELPETGYRDQRVGDPGILQSLGGGRAACGDLAVPARRHRGQGPHCPVRVRRHRPLQPFRP